MHPRQPGSAAGWLLDGCWVTPALDCGLLPGVGRTHWLAQGRMAEAVVRVSDLPGVQAIAFVNSLRGWVEAHLDENRVAALLK